MVRKPIEWPWPPIMITKTFAVLRTKIRQFRARGMPIDQQLAVIDWWIGQLNEMKAVIRGGGRL